MQAEAASESVAESAHLICEDDISRRHCSIYLAPSACFMAAR